MNHAANITQERTLINFFTSFKGPGPYFTQPDEMKRKFIAWPATHSMRLKCKANGSPPITYRWLKNGKTVPDRRLDPNMNRTNWFLRLKDLTLTDSAKYTCVVSNAYGSINHTYTLQVVGRCSSSLFCSFVLTVFRPYL